MSQSVPVRSSQAQDNLIKDTRVSGDLNFAPVQIDKIETLVVESSYEKVTQRELIKKSPYQGLKRFNFKDRDCFFGRDALIARLLEAVNRSSFSLVLGASGSGKSSVVRAGLIPELKKSLKTETFYDFIFTPNQDPFDSLRLCLCNDEKDYTFSRAEADLALEAQADTLAKVIRTLKQRSERWLIFVDQFEELFTNCSDSDKRKNFIAGLVQVANAQDPSVRIVIAMRSDFLEQFSFYPDLGAIAQNNIHLVTEMYPDELRQAIEQPAARHGVVFEKGLVDQIIEEVEGQKGYLPLLQYTLHLLWESECKTDANGRSGLDDRVLNKQSYAALEGVRGALKKRVNEIYDLLKQDDEEATETVTKEIFLNLVNIVDTESGNKAVSRRAYRHEFSGAAVEKILNKFVDEKLLVSSGDYSSQEELKVGDCQHAPQSATVEIAHEILLLSWDRLKQWIEEEKEAIILRNWLTGEARRWHKIRNEEDESKAQDELLKGSRLVQIVELRKKDAFKNLGGVRPEENEFIDASVELQERTEKEKTERRKREITTARRITAGSLLAVVVSTSLGLFAWDQTKQAKLNLAEALSSSSLSLLDAGKDLDAFVKAIRAGRTLQSQNVYNSEVMNALQLALNERSEFNRLQGHTDIVNSVSFSADGNTLVSASSDFTIKLWTVDTGTEIATLKGHNDTVNNVRFSPDERTLISSSSDRTIKLWDVETGEVIRTFEGHGNSVNYVVFSPDGRTIASASSDYTVKLWDVETGQLIRTFVGHNGLVWSVSFSPDGRTLASTGGDYTIKLWNVDTGQEIRTLQGHNGFIWSVTFSPDGRTLASGSNDKTINIWNSETGEIIRTLQGHDDFVKMVSFSPDGRTLASSSDDKTIKFWNLETGAEIRTFQGHDDSIRSVSFSPGGRMLASGSGDMTIKLWNLETREEVRTIQQYSNYYVHSVEVSPDGKILAAGSGDYTTKLWNLETGQEIRTLQGHSDTVWSVAFSPDSKTLVTGCDDSTVKLWNVETGELIRTLEGHTGSINTVSFSPDGKVLASGSSDRTTKLWDVETGAEIHTLEGRSGSIHSVGFSPDGKILAIGNFEKTVTLWNTETGAEIRTLEGHDNLVQGVSFAPDGKILATSSNDNTVKLWNLETGKEIRTLRGHSSIVYDVIFSPDGKTLATSSNDKTIKLWNVRTGAEIRTLRGHTDGVNSISFSPDGETLASGSFDTTIKLWNLSFWTLDLKSLIGRSCDWVHAYLANRPDSDPDKRLCDDIRLQE